MAFSLSMAQQNLCPVNKLDPEDPRCARVVFSGNFVEVTDPAELSVSLTTLALALEHTTLILMPTLDDD